LLNSSMQKIWHPLTLTDTCWMFMETKQWMWAQWEVVSGVFQKWCLHSSCEQCVPFAGADFYDHGMQDLFHHWQKCGANGGDNTGKYCFVAENLLFQTVLLCFLSVAVSLEISRGHYFQWPIYLKNKNKALPVNYGCLIRILFSGWNSRCSK